MDLRVQFPTGRRVDALMGAHRVFTDQSVDHGGDDSAPEPFHVFLASLATCAGLNVLAYCNAREIPLTGVWLEQHHEFHDATRALRKVTLTVHLPYGFPEEHRDGIAQAAAACEVAGAIAAPPVVAIGAVCEPLARESHPPPRG